MKDRFVSLLFRFRSAILALFSVLTLFFLWHACGIRVDAGFEKQLPKSHPFIKTFLEYQDEFGGANRILVAISAEEGNIFTPEFLRTLKKATEEAYYINGVNRAQIQSLFTPNVRFVEIVDGGFAGGNVIPADFDFSPSMIEEVRENLLKSTYVGRLVSNDFTSAMVSMQLTELDPATGEKVDYIQIAEQLETKLRQAYETDTIKIHIIGFAKAVGDIAAGAQGVLIFLGLTVILVGFLVNLFLHSWKLTLAAVLCSSAAVIWNVGLMASLGYGFDPLSILTPFLIFAIGISHSLQLLDRINRGVLLGRGVSEATQVGLVRLLYPALAALASDTLGFLTIYLIDVPIIQELALTASLGVVMLLFTNLILLPLVISTFTLPESHKAVLSIWKTRKEKLWAVLTRLSERRASLFNLCGAAIVFVIAAFLAQDLKIGDLHKGVPELRPDSRYNQDSRHIVEKYTIGVDILTVIVETSPNSCIDYDTVSYIDQLEWAIANNSNVQSTLSMPHVMKLVSAGWNEGHPKWRILSRNPQILVQSARSVETSTGLLNAGCSVMPVMVFLKDHRAEGIESVVNTIQQFTENNPHPEINVRLATGNAGVMAATNETVAKAQYPIVLWIYGAIICLCYLLFRCVRCTLCIVLPLGLVSVVAYALMAVMEIGLKTSSLPVAALGVGIGVDYGIYIFSQMSRLLHKGERLADAHRHALQTNGSAVLVTGLTLSLAISTWAFSDLQFQADMGILFSSMLFLNMLGAIFLVPAIAYFLFPKNR